MLRQRRWGFVIQQLQVVRLQDDRTLLRPDWMGNARIDARTPSSVRAGSVICSGGRMGCGDPR